MTRIHPIDSIVAWSADCNRLAIAGDGNRIPKLIVIRFADDVLADLYPIVRAEIEIALQGEDPNIPRSTIICRPSGRATDDGHAIGSDIHRISVSITDGIAVNDLAE